MNEQFKIDGVVIATPFSYQPILSTTSTADSKRDQTGDMHNTPMFTIGGYDIEWNALSWDKTSVILNAVIGKPSFIFHHPDPRVPGAWIDKEFYVSDANMDAKTLEYGVEMWDGLTLQLRSSKKV